MPVITINGPIGSGPIEIGQMVAQRLEINYVDRLVFAEAAKLVGTPVVAFVEKEQRSMRFGDRLARLLQAMGNTDHDFGVWMDTLPETYVELTRDLGSTSHKVDDKAFIEATSAVVKDLHRTGNVVIIGRGANMILAGAPGVVHIGMLAPLEVRVETMIRREHFTRPEAESYVEDLERARINFFRRFFKVNPQDLSLYHMMLNLGEIRAETAADIIVHAVNDLSR